MNKHLKVCTIGGGSGMPIVNKGLILSGFRNVQSIVTTFDSGGDSGRMRTDERGRIMAYSDYWRSLISLWKDGEQKNVWEDMLRYRDGRGRNFGNIFFQFMAEKTGNLSNVDALFEKLTKADMCGSVIPVSFSPADVCFSTMTGKKYCGEHNLDDLRMSMDRVDKIWLQPEVEANEEAIKALKTVDAIIISPGSMCGSVLTNFLPRGMAQAYNESKAKKILMTNIVSVANENDHFTQDEYVEEFCRYLKNKHPFDLVVMADLSVFDKKLLDKALHSYSLEHSFPIKINEKSHIKTIIADIATIEEKNFRFRHSQEKLAVLFDKLEI